MPEKGQVAIVNMIVVCVYEREKGRERGRDGRENAQGRGPKLITKSCIHLAIRSFIHLFSSGIQRAWCVLMSFPLSSNNGFFMISLILRVNWSKLSSTVKSARSSSFINEQL